MRAAVHDLSTGVIRAVITSPEPAVVALNVQPGEAVHVGEVELHRHYIRDGVAHEYPPRPGPWAVWDGQRWVDPRSPADLAADLIQRRHATQLDKSDLLIRLAVAGILTPEEAEEAAGGTIPASMLPMLEALPPDAQMAARVKWRADTTISRTHPVIVSAAHALGIPDAQLDQIFGVADQPGTRS